MTDIIRVQKEYWAGVSEDLEFEIPLCWQICSNCDGNGEHTNRNIDGNGITASEWENDWDEEERETYMSGGYDVTCKECGGTGKVYGPNYDAMTQAQTEILENHLNVSAQMDYEDAYTRRMESGGY